MGDAIDAGTPGWADRLAQVEGPIAVLAPLTGPAEVERLVDAFWDHRELLARRCVGVAAVSDDDGVRRAVLARAGRMPFPLTALPDRDQALGWLAGQRAAGTAGVRPAGGGRTVAVTPAVEDYVLAHLAPPPHPVLRELVGWTADRDLDDTMAIGADQGQLLALLVRVSGARDVVEVGTFTGTSALWLAGALPEGGRLTCFELDPEPIELARRAWRAAGVDDRIDVVLGPALDGLAALPPEPCVDLGFLDAEKDEYLGYVELLLPRLRPGGMLLVDNTLWAGAVADPRVDDGTTVALRAFNDAVAARDDLEVLLLTVGDGLTVLRRR